MKKNRFTAAGRATWRAPRHNQAAHAGDIANKVN